MTKIEKNIEKAEDGPLVGGLLKMSKGMMGDFSHGKDYVAVAMGSASVAGDLLGGEVAKGILSTANGLKVTGFTKHALERAMERGVKPSAILDALKKPLKTGSIVQTNLEDKVRDL